MINHSSTNSVFRPRPISLNQKHMRIRKAKDSLFAYIARGATFTALVILISILCSILYWASPALFKAEIELSLPLELLSKETFIPQPTTSTALKESLILLYPNLKNPSNLNEVFHLFPLTAQKESQKALIEYITQMKKGRKSKSIINLWVPIERDAAEFIKELKNNFESPSLKDIHLTPAQQNFLKDTYLEDKTRISFNTSFFTSVDSQNPELAGMKGAILGSLYVMLITLCVAVPIGILSAIYLEEFAPDTRLTRFIEINLNNLAAVPSVVFGLLGLAIFIVLFKIPRSSALVGGLTLSLMLLPIMIVATRTSLRAIPSSLRDAARGLGASSVQVVFHHVLPLAFPGIITGTLLSIARILGESASLLMVGMMAFITLPPKTFLSPTTVLPMQIYQWVERPEPGFEELSSAAILCLLVFLACLNWVALFLRRKLEKKW